MEIRYINESDDLPIISSIYEESWKYAYKNIIPQSFLDSIPEGKWINTVQKFHTLIMTDKGKTIGTSSFCASRWEKFSGYGEIVSIYFLPEYMGKGCGGELLETAVNELHKLGYEKVLLWVLEDNTRARNFYEKHGFKCTDEFLEDNIGGKDLREIMYVLE